MGSYKIFVSHSWSKDEELTNLTNLLNNRNYISFEYTEFTKHSPVESIDADYVKLRIRQRLLISDVVLAIAHVSASYSGFIEYELKKAKEYGIKIIGVRPYGQERISSVVQEYADEVVYWNTESIVLAIRKLSK